jgi:hypothetical protein
MLNSVFFNKILVFLRLRKKKTHGTCIPMREVRPFWDFQLFDVADHNRRSRWVELYYILWRFFHNSPWGNPRQAYREIKWFIQRGRRGWADCDTWSLDDYLTSWLPAALRYLKEHKHGVPSAVVEAEDCREDGQVSDEGLERAESRWNAIMDKMIEGFEADRRAQEGLYEKELGEYPMNRPAGVSADTWEKVKSDHFKASRALAERDQKLFEEGSALFLRFYHNLWD